MTLPKPSIAKRLAIIAREMNSERCGQCGSPLGEPSPGAWRKDIRHIAQEIEELAAQMRKRHVKRYGPLLAEIDEWADALASKPEGT